MARIEKTVFISYRRTDVYAALAVYQDLSGKGYDVFFDYSSISSGDFEQIIISNIKARAHFILILTPTALDRCSEPGDWLRREIETAIDEQRNIVPLFFNGFNFGSSSVSEKLTGKLRDLSRYNGLNVHEDYFPAAMDRLSAQFLKVPLNTVLHPVSAEVRNAVIKEQSAVNDALAEKWEDLKEFFKSADEKTIRSEQDKDEESSVSVLTSGKSKRSSLRLYGIGAGILVLIALGIAAINGLFSPSTAEATPTMTSPAITNTIGVESPLTESVNTSTIPASTSTPTEQPTLTVTPSPTLGVGSTKISPKDGMVMVYVPAGEFRMGFQGVGHEINEKPVHTVDLDAFWIDQTEVTNGMYAKCVDEGKCDPPGSAGSAYYENSEYENYPVTSVTWEPAGKYCAWAGRRLPTEAEWEKAARGLNQRIYPWGNNIDCSRANYYDTKAQQYCFNPRKGGTSPVMNYEAGKSPYGAYDMAGNVWEWVADWYGETYYYNSPSSNPKGPSDGNLHVARGGSWSDGELQARASNRGAFDAASNIGFRCAMSASP